MNTTDLENFKRLVDIVEFHEKKIEELDDKVSEIIDILSNFSKALDNTEIMDTERR